MSRALPLHFYIFCKQNKKPTEIRRSFFQNQKYGYQPSVEDAGSVGVLLLPGSLKPSISRIVVIASRNFLMISMISSKFILFTSVRPLIDFHSFSIAHNNKKCKVFFDMLQLHKQGQ